MSLSSRLAGLGPRVEVGDAVEEPRLGVAAEIPREDVVLREPTHTFHAAARALRPSSGDGAYNVFSQGRGRSFGIVTLRARGRQRVRDTRKVVVAAVFSVHSREFKRHRCRQVLHSRGELRYLALEVPDLLARPIIARGGHGLHNCTTLRPIVQIADLIECVIQ